MSEQLTTKRNGGNKDYGEVSEAQLPNEPVSDSKVTERTDELLDEIDEILEENAEEFVRSYVQKGGQ